ncbi:glycoside hydrolase superfamily [Polychytrium aggregatum]|uniref:glycoside hydrolase superfamily n=1 Tax=Polychytrium aggregatum TaxID=110093 RepID=UPI0022FDDF75|nr:glycoside hydrolase superfamily [Polychytrium aggregatum]KAI9202955.1 glycoside hydrolase superfamily [Polychytrium aggregatum]
MAAATDYDPYHSTSSPTDTVHDYGKANVTDPGSQRPKCSIKRTRSALDYLWPLPASVTDKYYDVKFGSLHLEVHSSDDDQRDYVVQAFGRFKHSLAAKKSGKSSRRLPVIVNILGSDCVDASSLQGIDESYTLDVSDVSIHINAQNQVGAIYALQTLSQLVTDKGSLVAASITDKPRFPYRGFMLDTARNFFPVVDIKRILDGLAYSKINVLHWHIYDSQSFPIKWDRYPGLLNAAFKYDDGTPKIYTKDDIRKIIAYAFARNIRVIPEFEFPGHNAVFHFADPSFVLAYAHSPWDGRNGYLKNDSTTQLVGWGAQYCNEPPCGQLDPTNYKAMCLVNDLVNEVGSWFEDPVLHVGHDEVNGRVYGKVPDNWDTFDPTVYTNPVVQAFEKQFVPILAKAKKQYAAWDDAATDFGIEKIIPSNAIITQWQTGQDGTNGGKVNDIAAKGFTNIVVSPSSHYYLDCSPSVAWCMSNPLPNISYNLPGYKTLTGQWHNWTMIYQYDPLSGVLPANVPFVKGGFGSLWSETIKRHNLDRYVFPRMAAIAERLWSYTNAAYDPVATPRRLNRFRASLINELGIASADLDYLGNGEGTVFRTELCDGPGTTAAFQKTSECCFAGQPTAPGASENYCEIACTYKTNSFVYTIPANVPYDY